ncbi:MAG: hypothetical protein ABW185_15115 [Sedimenticola sp.]
MNTSLYAHSSIPAAVPPEKVSLHLPESYPSAPALQCIFGNRLRPRTPIHTAQLQILGLRLHKIRPTALN